MNRQGATPLFIDTGAFYARADTDDSHHETATQLFEHIRSGDLPYRPLFTQVRQRYSEIVRYGT